MIALLDFWLLRIRSEGQGLCIQWTLAWSLPYHAGCWSPLPRKTWIAKYRKVESSLISVDRLAVWWVRWWRRKGWRQKQWTRLWQQLWRLALRRREEMGRKHSLPFLPCTSVRITIKAIANKYGASPLTGASLYLMSIKNFSHFTVEGMESRIISSLPKFTQLDLTAGGRS